MKSHYFVQSFAGVSVPEPFLKASDLFVGITYGGVVELYLQTQLQLNSKPNRTGYDSNVDGSSSNGLHVLAKGRQCYSSRIAKCTSMLCTYSDHITTSANPEKYG